MNKSGNLEIELNRKCEVINGEISAIGGKYQVGKKEVIVKLKLCETCVMPALLCGLEVWGKIGSKDKMNGIEKIQGRALKRIYNFPV